MQAIAALQALARYNRIVNERLYASCAELSDAAYREQRRGSFGSIHALLNHILLGDRIWMARFRGGGSTTPPLGTILFDDFAELRGARVTEDAGIEAFFASAPEEFTSRVLAYQNSKGAAREDPAGIAALHFFNHQTHHRGQVHVMLSQTAVAPPSLDLHWILLP